EGREKVRPRLGLMMVFALLGALTLVTPAHAAFPGANGKLALLVTEAPYSSGGGMYSMNPDGSDATLITTAGATPTWSPDGTRLAYALGQSREAAGIYSINSDGSGNTKLTNPGPYAMSDYEPTWSPDGDRIAFSRFRYTAEGYDWDILVMNSDGTGQTNITNTV